MFEYLSFSELPRTLYCAVYYYDGEKKIGNKNHCSKYAKRQGFCVWVRMWNECTVRIIGTLKCMSTFTKRAVLRFSETIPSDNILFTLHYHLYYCEYIGRYLQPTVSTK